MNRHKIYLSIVGSLFVLVGSLGFGLRAAQAASPPTSFKYKDSTWSNIIAQTSNGAQTYHTTPGSKPGIYNGGGAVGYDGCVAVIETSDKKYDGDTKAQWWASCQNGVRDKRSITISGGQSVTLSSNVNSVQRQVFDVELCATLKSLDENLYNKECKDYIFQKDLDKAAAAICKKHKDKLQEQCDDYKNKTFNQDNAPNNDNKDVGTECDTSANPLTWVVCPLVSGFTDVINGLDSLITSQLSVGSPGNSDNPNQIFCDSRTEKDGGSYDTCRAYHTAWSSFRNIALGMLVIASLIIIISEMSGLEFFDAYTIRKLLPRLLVAAFAITLSWQLMQFFVTFTNALGFGIRYLIYQPFVSAGFDQLTINGDGATVGGLIGIGALGALGVFGLLSYAVTGLLAVLIAFLVLILRQLIIIVLIIIAPVAIAAYILPNTQNGFRIWWDSFAKALMMFPIIAAFIAAGRVFSAVASKSDSVIGQIIGFVAYFLPYFLIPLTFRLAGTATSTIGNAISQRSQGGFQGIKQFRGNRAKQNMAATKNFSRFSDRNAIGRSLNTVGGAIASPRSMSRGLRGIRSARSTGRAAQGAAILKDNAIAQANSGDDNFWLAVANKDLAKRKIEKARAKSQDMSLSAEDRSEAQQDLYARERALDAAKQMGGDANSLAVRTAAFQELNKTGFQWSAGEEGYKELSETARELTGGVGGDERGYTAMMDAAQYNLRSSGQRFDLAGINHGAGYDPKAGTDKASLYELANAKPASIKGMVEKLDPATIGQDHAVVYKELQAMLPNSKGASRDAVVKEIERLKATNIEGYMALPDPSGETVVERDPTSRTGATRTRPLTRGEKAERYARTYERPDPNRM